MQKISSEERHVWVACFLFFCFTLHTYIGDLLRIVQAHKIISFLGWILFENIRVVIFHKIKLVELNLWVDLGIGFGLGNFGKFSSFCFVGFI